MKNDEAKFLAIAKEWTKKYATASRSSKCFADIVRSSGTLPREDYRYDQTVEFACTLLRFGNHLYFVHERTGDRHLVVC